MYLARSAPFDLPDDRSEFFRSCWSSAWHTLGPFTGWLRKPWYCKATPQKQKQPLNLQSNRGIAFNFLLFPPRHSLSSVQGAGRLRGNRPRYAEVSYDPGTWLVTGAARVSLGDIQRQKKNTLRTQISGFIHPLYRADGDEEPEPTPDAVTMFSLTL